MLWGQLSWLLQNLPRSVKGVVCAASCFSDSLCDLIFLPLSLCPSLPPSPSSLPPLLSSLSFLPPSPPSPPSGILYQLCFTDNHVCPGPADNPGGHNCLQMTDLFPTLTVYESMDFVYSLFYIWCQANRLCLGASGPLLSLHVQMFGIQRVD